jgi:glycosyltransferase involved in cell wall biosynthesis
MPQVSINILTKDRSELLRRALNSVVAQSFTDYEVIAVNDGSGDGTAAVLGEYSKRLPLTVITHRSSMGIIAGRQEALAAGRSDYVTLLDDDDEWLDREKLKKQIDWFKANPTGVLLGSAVEYKTATGSKIVSRAVTDAQIRRTMLLRNNFFTSTVMFQKAAALKAGGFVNDGIDAAEDYDLWLRLGKMGKMANFPGVFTAYRAPVYTKNRFRNFLKKQLNLIDRHKRDYPFYQLSRLILELRILIS